MLVENLRRVAQRIVTSRAAREEADLIADKLLGVNGQKADANALINRRGANEPLVPSFAVQLVQRLRDQDPKVLPALEWLEARITAQGTSSEMLVREEHQRQGASNVTVRNIITSMRLMSDVDWAEFFESVSLVDEVLNSSAGFSAMDFATRNLYRTAIEELGRGSRLSELQIARQVLTTADTASDARERDPGYHLIADGREKLERAIGFRAPLRDWRKRIAFTVGARDYVAAIACLSALVLAVPLALLQRAGIHGGMLWLLGILGAVPAMDIAVALINRAVTRGVGASRLPGLALRDGIPEELRTLVAVPVMLNSRTAVEQHLHRLEIHYLASPDDQLHFALLSDWMDAPEERMPSDDALLDIAVLGVARLNRRYGPAKGGDRFLLLHRKRQWSESEQRWWAGTQTRQAAGAQPAAAQRCQQRVTSPAAQESVGAQRRALRAHAGRRHPRAARNAARLIAKMRTPQPPALRSQVGRVVDATPSCNRAWRSRCRWKWKRRRSSACSRAPPAWIRTPPRSRMCTRTCWVKAVSPARASMTWMLSKPRWRSVFQKARCCRMTCSKASLRAQVSPRTWKWSRNSRRVTTWPRCASTAGYVATGSCCLGFLAAAMPAPPRMAGDTPAFR